ncbi:MAG TPA: methyltransferase domain-containing protein [Dehalococcoidia bacterium]|nr:methyltransferase domain-containing protein [Dehalococcoidia bacterium]
MPSLDPSYDTFPRIEREFGVFLDESLDSRGPDSLFDIVAGLGLPPGSRVLDLGCGEGGQSLDLARRFGFRVTGVDPVARHIDLARAALAGADDAMDVTFERGFAEEIPFEAASFDLIWCREVLVLIESLDAFFAECRRVLRPGGLMLLYQMFSGPRMTPEEANDLWESQVGFAASADAANVEAALGAAGFIMEQRTDFGGEWGEYAEEQSAAGTRRLLHAARLLREPERYIARFGQSNYDIMLGDCLWHVYRMIGKLTGRAYVLS